MAEEGGSRTHRTRLTRPNGFEVRAGHRTRSTSMPRHRSVSRPAPPGTREQGSLYSTPPGKCHVALSGIGTAGGGARSKPSPVFECAGHSLPRCTEELGR